MSTSGLLKCFIECNEKHYVDINNGDYVKHYIRTHFRAIAENMKKQTTIKYNTETGTWHNLSVTFKKEILKIKAYLNASAR